MAELPFAIMCPNCRHTVEVSEDDPDASLSDMYEHLFVQHAAYVHATATALLAKVREVPF